MERNSNRVSKGAQITKRAEKALKAVVILAGKSAELYKCLFPISCARMQGCPQYLLALPAAVKQPPAG